MKFSKKLLAALLPVAAASSLVPALSSCSNGSSYDIGYGDEINCLDEKVTNYHSIDDVKNAAKKHVDVEPLPTIGLVEFIELRNTDIGKQRCYYDLLATLTENNIKFHLIYNKEDTTLKITYLDDSGAQQVIDGTYAEWSVDGLPQVGVAQQIYIRVSIDATKPMIKKLSYTFKNTVLLPQ